MLPTHLVAWDHVAEHTVVAAEKGGGQLKEFFTLVAALRVPRPCHTELAVPEPVQTHQPHTCPQRVSQGFYVSNRLTQRRAGVAEGVCVCVHVCLRAVRTSVCA